MSLHRARGVHGVQEVSGGWEEKNVIGTMIVSPPPAMGMPFSGQRGLHSAMSKSISQHLREISFLSG